MNITTQTTKTFSISDLTESQAEDLLSIAVESSEDERGYTRRQRETLNNMRQALLATGLTLSSSQSSS